MSAVKWATSWSELVARARWLPRSGLLCVRVVLQALENHKPQERRSARSATRRDHRGPDRFVVRMDRVAYRVTLRVRFTCCLNFSLPSEAKEWTQYTHKLKRAPPPPPPPNTHTGLERTQPSAIRIAQKHGCQHRHKEGIEDVRTSLRLALHRKREKKVGRSVV